MKRSSRRRPRLGQHFLTGAWAARALARAAEISENDTVLEIGPGKGALTRELLALGAHVIAIEKDEALAEYLKTAFADDIRTGKLVLIADDIRSVSPEKLGLKRYVLAANIPYYITGEIIRMFLSTRIQPRAMVLLVQKEVAGRIVARDNKESILSLSVKAYGTPTIVAKVSRGNFSPAPSVDSAILAITDISTKFFDTIDEAAFFRVVRAGFSSKRKLLAGNLAKHVGSRPKALDALTHCGVPEKARAEDVPLPKWKCLVQYVVGRT
ncbi:ribosomal RNA small subunit methyltransferase A [Candidatus Kaiserbacteria bacterium RIFCSPLOWO2_01_FULL_54_13]|uniref:Ribosomal RNA small subunit methyltransferase A n=1 Tax=Candidatus Kaiserbacteria bacterium RIFCSPLOWO2_01_FULL_54_13 TaxID=1798512 RepID=A0A1F6EZU0_9BACT|nr:MAG: ribosomal RNA small subunit methyltransferase A [Candidatus Kaiserbacteria bacterium RIFCSPLOWO2_01_FULL_54_13]